MSRMAVAHPLGLALMASPPNAGSYGAQLRPQALSNSLFITNASKVSCRVQCPSMASVWAWFGEVLWKFGRGSGGDLWAPGAENAKK